MKRAFGSTVLAAFVALTLIAGATARPADPLAGEVRFRAFESDDASAVASSDVSGLTLYPVLEPSMMAWSVDGEAITVNWTRFEGQAFASTPATEEGAFKRSLGEYSGEYSYGTASGELLVAQADASFLATATTGENLRVDVHNPQNVEISPASGDSWAAGEGATDSSQQGFALQATYRPEPGTPVAAVNGADSVELLGNFSLFVWGTMVTLEVEGATKEYRSGSWFTNSTGEADGVVVVREEHIQLLRIDIVQGRLVIPSWGGNLRWASVDVSALVDGTALFSDAAAHLQSPNYMFDATNDAVRLTGNLLLSIDAGAEIEELRCRVEATAAFTNIGPSGPNPAGATGAAKIISGGQPGAAANQVSTSALRGPDAMMILWTLTLVGTILAAAWFWHVRSTRAGVQDGSTAAADVIRRAEDALVAGDTKGARRVLAPLLKADPGNTAAWFVHGASLIHEHRYQEAIDDLKPIAGKASDAAGLAFLLCIAYLRVRRPGRALKWATVASKQPEFLEQIRTDSSFEAVAKKLPGLALPVPMKTAAPLDVAYN